MESGRWASCGAMHLTGDPHGPPLAPPTDAAGLVDDALVDLGLAASVLGERAALLGLGRAGQTSCGGATRLLRAADGWVALSLAREEDVAALPALFESEAVRSPDRDAAWAPVATAVATRPAEEVVARSELLGVACARLGEPGRPFGADRGQARPRRSAERTTTRSTPLVVDLSGLWAGPLATSLLARTGWSVVKVEDRRRPDGARRGNRTFFDLLNGGKRSVALDVDDPAERCVLADLVDAADVVVTSCRARAVDQLDLDPDGFLSGGTDRVWVAITAHGWDSDRVGFGDDAAVAAGLVAWHPDDGEPRFVADAVADPLCGALAARACLDAWHAGGRWFVDAPLAGAAASVATVGPAVMAERSGGGPPDGDGGPAWHLDGVPVAEPTARRPVARAAALGTDTGRVRADLGR